MATEDGVPEPAPAAAPRGWQSACPNCGASVAFQSPTSVFAVCGFCRSQVVRDGASLARIGESAEPFDDHSALRLGASGRYRGAAFTVVGRRQLRSAAGVWSEWHTLFFDGPGGDRAGIERDAAPRSGWLSEDNGRYVFSFESVLREPAPLSTDLRAGDGLSVDGRLWSVASVAVATLVTAEGELPVLPKRTGGFVVADLRSTTGDVATLDYQDATTPSWSVGQSVTIGELAMQGLADTASQGAVAGRSLSCPSCGAAITLALKDTRSVVCGQCDAVVAVGDGIGEELRFHTQATGSVEPLIPLGTVGRLAVPDHRQSRAAATVEPWQVVGYAERCTLREVGEDEQTFWREYLIYHRTEGFAFVVDSDDGWSIVRPITGVPQRAGGNARLDGVLYRQSYEYTSRVTHVLGEFYWPLVKDQKTRHNDFVGTGAYPGRRLNREQTGAGSQEEVTWSAGEVVDAEAIRRAFGLPEDRRAALARDVKLTAAKSTVSPSILLWVTVVVVVLLLSLCSSDDRCDDERAAFGEQSAEYRQCLQRGGAAARTSGGSYGGWSGGGGHK